jgi:hypothetical protein
MIKHNLKNQQRQQFEKRGSTRLQVDPGNLYFIELCLQDVVLVPAAWTVDHSFL